MARPTDNALKRVLFLLPLPLVWVAIAYMDWIVPLENIAMDWRFKVRGPISSSLPIVYVNRDTYASQEYGEDFFPRKYYARAAEALLTLGDARVVFFDIVMSTYAASESIDYDIVLAGDIEFQEVLQSFPEKVVLASNYTGIRHPFDSVESRLPLKYMGDFDRSRSSEVRGYNAEQNPYPETPDYPIWSPSYQDELYPPEFFGGSWGRAALIDVAVERNAGAEIRWIPAFVEVHNELPALAFVNSVISWKRFALADANAVSFQEDDDYYYVQEQENGQWVDTYVVPKYLPKTFYTAAIEMLLAANPGSTATIKGNLIEIHDEEGTSLYEIPLTDGQLLEVNWFSPWNSPFESEDPASYDPSVDPYNPMFSMVDVIANYEQWDSIQFEVLAWLERESTGTLTELDYTREEIEILFERAAEIEKWFAGFNNAIVLIGPTDPLLQDVAPTPFEAKNTPRVQSHGDLLKTIHAGLFITRMPFWVTGILTVALTMLISYLQLQGGTASQKNKFGSAVLLVAYVFAVFVAFSNYHLVIPLIVPVMSAVSTSLVGVIIQLLDEEKQKGRIKNLFGTYVSPEIVERMVDSGEEPQLGGHTQEITAFFSDIQSFSTFSELVSPQELVILMNEYLDGLTEILEECGGTLDKYIGDAIVGIFNAPVELPDHALRACISSILMQQKQAELREYWASQGDRWPTIVHLMRTRIGLNTGPATVGNFGSKKRFNYTMMGDTVNLAARNESGAKSFGVFTMVSEQTKIDAEKAGDDCVFRYLDKIVVKGRSKPVSVFECVCLRSDLDGATENCLDLYNDGIGRYLNRDWDAALDCFRRSMRFEPSQPDEIGYVKTNPSLVMIDRCQAMKENPPPEDWDGRYVMQTK